MHAGGKHTHTYLARRAVTRGQRMMRFHFGFSGCGSMFSKRSMRTVANRIETVNPPRLKEVLFSALVLANTMTEECTKAEPLISNCIESQRNSSCFTTINFAISLLVES